MDIGHTHGGCEIGEHGEGGGSPEEEHEHLKETMKLVEAGEEHDFEYDSVPEELMDSVVEDEDDSGSEYGGSIEEPDLDAVKSTKIRYTRRNTHEHSPYPEALHQLLHHC